MVLPHTALRNRIRLPSSPASRSIRDTLAARRRFDPATTFSEAALPCPQTSRASRSRRILLEKLPVPLFKVFARRLD